jgi:signal transduction histidine kinase
VIYVRADEVVEGPGLRFVFLMLVLVSPGVVAQSAAETPRTIRVVTDNAYAPYSFQTDDDKLQGILVDQWRAWEKKTGIKAEIRAMDWGEALRRTRAGEFDVIDCIVETIERRDYFDFTPAYATIEAPIFFRNDISGITDIASLKGFPVGVKAGDQHIDQLRANGVTTVIPFQNNDEIIAAARQHKINVFVVDAPSAFYLLNKTGIEDEFRHSATIFRDELRRAVRKGDANLLRTVSEGFAAIEPRELTQIHEKWFGRTINSYGRYFIYAGYAAAVAVPLIAGLVGWNRALRKGVLQRTAALGESEHRFRQLAENLQALSRRLVELQESERRQLSRELHDRVGQNLTALKINLDILQTALASHGNDEVRARVDDSAALLESTMDTIENVMSELRPPMLDDHGLAAALDWHARNFSKRTGIAVAVRGIEPAVRPALQVEIALFRIAQEALNNVAKHARAHRVEIALDQANGECAMFVEDDGIGFDGEEDASDKAKRGLGMVTMRERAQAVGGSFEVQALSGRGTQLTVRIPY